MSRASRRKLTGGLLAAVLGLGAFVRAPGAENVHAVQMVALIAVGLGLGVALAQFMGGKSGEGS